MNTPNFVLYWSPGSCARVPLIALEEIGVEYEARLLARGDASSFADYTREVNPKGKVPALLVDGRLITENPAIETYLDKRFPDARLLPQDPEGGLDALIMMSWFAAGIHPMITRSRFPRNVSSVPESYDSIREIALNNLRDSFGQIEDLLSDGREWLFGDWTILDAYLLWLWFRAMGSGLTGAEFPKVDDLARRCQSRPSATRIIDLEAKAYADLQQAGKAMPNPPPLQAGWLPEPV